MKKYKKLIVGGLALALLALKDLAGFDLPYDANAIYVVVTTVLGAFGIYGVSND